jgi:hypothetical protein
MVAVRQIRGRILAARWCKLDSDKGEIARIGSFCVTLVLSEICTAQIESLSRILAYQAIIKIKM